MSRPLSAWVAYVDGNVLGPINDGDDRADARSLTDFDRDWRRVAIPWPGKGQVLGLSQGDAYAVELDSYGNPIPVSPSAAESIAELERNWPHGRIDVSALANESVAVRYWLLTRLNAEGDPDDAVFSLLPWDLLERAMTAAELLLSGEAAELVELRHWLNPAVVGLAGPLEQLDHGLRTGDPEITNKGGQTLLTNLQVISLRRIPTPIRFRLAGLAERLSFVDSALAASVTVRLTTSDSDNLSLADRLRALASRLLPVMVVPNMAYGDETRPRTATLTFTDDLSLLFGERATATVFLKRTDTSKAIVLIDRVSDDARGRQIAVSPSPTGEFVTFTQRQSVWQAELDVEEGRLPKSLYFKIINGGPEQS